MQFGLILSGEGLDRPSILGMSSGFHSDGRYGSGWPPCDIQFRRKTAEVSAAFAPARPAGVVGDQRSPNRAAPNFSRNKEMIMLFTVALILFVLWALGLFTGYAMGGLIHLLLVVALVVVVIQFLSGRRAV